MEVIDSKICPFCAEKINIAAIKCKHCGEHFNSENRQNFQQGPTIVIPESKVRKWSPGVAALLSFLIPGAGQIYKGNVMSGILWLIFVVIGYAMLFIPGLILHLICIFAAASGDPYK
jgi:hypothetical protein